VATSTRLAAAAFVLAMLVSALWLVYLPRVALAWAVLRWR